MLVLTECVDSKSCLKSDKPYKKTHLMRDDEHPPSVPPS